MSMDRDRAPVIMAIEDRAPAVPHTQVEVGTSGEIDARLVAHLRIQDEPGPGGPRVELRGWLSLPGVNARLRIRPSEAGGQDAARERTKLIPLVAPGRTVPAMPGPNAWHIPADSRLALRACDFARHPLTPERDAGLCREGSSDAEIPVQLAVRLAARLEVRPDARPWVEPRGFVLSARGELTLLNGLLLRLNYWPAHGDARGDARGPGRGTIEWPVVPTGRRLHGSVRELLGLTPGTWLLIRFQDARGDAIDDERIVGRCALQ